MAIPFADRKAWADLPDIALHDKPTFTLAEIHGEFSKVLHVSLDNVFECIQVVSRTKLCLTFKDKPSLEETTSIGLEFRGQPITLTPLHSKTWVSVSRIQFGIPWDSIKAALAPYGPIDRARRESLNNVYTGTISVLMQVTNPIPSKLNVAGRTCFIYYRGQPRTCFSCGETGHQKRDCQRSSMRAEVINALANSSTWGSPTRSANRNPGTDPHGDSPKGLAEQPDATSDSLLPDSASVPGQTVTDHNSTEEDAPVIPPGPICITPGQQSDTNVVPPLEPMDSALYEGDATLVPGVELTPPVETPAAIVEASGEQSATEDTPIPVPQDNSTPADTAIGRPEDDLTPPVDTTLPPQVTFAVLSKLVQSCGNASGHSNLPQRMDTESSASDVQLENSTTVVTLLHENVPPYGETGSTNSGPSDQDPIDPMDQSPPNTGPEVSGDNASRTASLRLTDIDLSQPDFGIGPWSQREKGSSRRKKNIEKKTEKVKRLSKSAQSSITTAETVSPAPWVRTRTKPSVPPNPSHRLTNSFAVLTDHPSTDLSETVLSQEIPPASPSETDQSAPECRVAVFQGMGLPVVSDSDIPDVVSDSSVSEEYSPYLTESGNLLPNVCRPEGPTIPNHPLPDSEYSLSSDGEGSDVEHPGS